MSRRYGRNQKRAHRQRIEQLERVKAEVMRQMQHQLREIHELRSTLDTAAEVMGPHWVGLPPKVIEALWMQIDEGRHPADAPRPFKFSLPTEREALSLGLERYQQSFVELEKTVFMEPMDVWLQEARECVHVRLDLGNGHFAYALSRTAIEQTPTRALACRIGREFTRSLERLLSRKRGRSHG